MNFAEHAIIQSIYIKNFRSLYETDILECGQLNVFIGKNNAGKSNILASIQKIFDHLRGGYLVAPWRVNRYTEEFTDKDISQVMQIGVELLLPVAARQQLQEELSAITPQMARSIDQLKNERTVSFILRFVPNRNPYQYIESISLGKLNSSDKILAAAGINLVSVPPESAASLFSLQEEVIRLKKTVKHLEKLRGADSHLLESFFSDRSRNISPRYIIERLVGEDESSLAMRELQSLVTSSDSIEDFRTKVSAAIAQAQDKAEEVQRAETDGEITSYTGSVRGQPSYIASFMRAFGDTNLLHLAESKKPIGRPEAELLLSLKVKRGGPERLRLVQQTVKSLLGVNLDAFQGDSPNSSAEMDVDEFLAEANGAGIRESLRLILDLELQAPKVVLLEEPEVHLHPGLEHAMHSYLQEKSKTMQIFLTTHSTNFVDMFSNQNIYLVARDKEKHTECEIVSNADAPVRIPSELGMRLSTVFMFDRLIFVEGPSDEAVIREFAKKLDFDIARASVAFVHMGGIKNFTHYAIEGTLDLLTRRRVCMWFVIDKDERDQEEIGSMLKRLDGRAKLSILPRRELENFLLDPPSIAEFINDKFEHQQPKRSTVSIEDVKQSIEKVAESIRDEVIRLYVEKDALSPIYLRGNGIVGTIEERLEKVIRLVQSRQSEVGKLRDQCQSDISKNWNTERAIELAPGSTYLNLVCSALGSTFKKESGDSVRLARLLRRDAIDKFFVSLLNEVTRA